jgi:UDP-glucose 4-epimerase
MHFAAHAYVGESVQNPRKYFSNNVTSAIAFLDAVMDSRVRKFIDIGSGRARRAKSHVDRRLWSETLRQKKQSLSHGP